MASRFNIPFYETSAKQNMNVSEAFDEIARSVKVRLETENASAPKSDVVNVYEKGPAPDKKKGCC